MSHRNIDNAITVLSLLATLGLQAACASDGGNPACTGMRADMSSVDEAAFSAGAASAAGTGTGAGRGCTVPGNATVLCGSSSCASDTQACCLDAYAGTAACFAGDVWCGTPTSTGAPATCDEQSDCPPGQSCCVHSGAGYLSILCMPDNECPGDFPYVTNRVLCTSPAEQRACSPGETCTPLSGAIPSGWSACSR
jgi:hypothetical protein